MTKHPNCKPAVRLATAILCFATAAAFAQSSPPAVTLTDPAKVATPPRAAASSPAAAGQAGGFPVCPLGYYTGKESGRPAYTKDKYIWAVTPGFKANFCMPDAFVDQALRGAEAIAARLVADESEEICRMVGGNETCASRRDVKFEIFMSSEKRLPKLRDLPGARSPRTPATRLLAAVGPVEKERRLKMNQRIDAVGLERFLEEEKRTWPVFATSQFALVGIRNNQVAWASGLNADEYRESIFAGIDYLSLDGLAGSIADPALDRAPDLQFAIVVFNPGDQRRVGGMNLSDFAATMPLPISFFLKIRAVAKAR